MLRTTFIRAADHARKQDRQLARLYCTQIAERGKDCLGALWLLAGNVAEPTCAVMDHGMPYVICGTDGTALTAAEAVIAAQCAVLTDVRARRRHKKGKAPQRVLAGQSKPRARGAGERSHLPHPRSSTARPQPVKLPNRSSKRQTA